ncbi:MAG: ABC transporter ATP-binding protein [Lachnospiraceae bacterium]|jgi:ATP-binding cassette subfamily B multidrug efflux pump|nr:ABC transporter ATP-binding protein [Lachnospiraceae bacterium]
MKGNKKYTIFRLGRYMLQYKWLLLLALFLTIGSNLFSLIGPMLSGYAIDAIEPGFQKVEFEKVFYYIILMIGFYIVSSFLSYLLSILMIYISRKVVYRMRKDVFDNLLMLPVGYFDTHQTGDIISCISYDIDTVNTSLSSDLVQIFATIITVIGAFSMMIVISPRLVLVFLFTVPLSMFLTKKITKRTRPLFKNRSKKLGELNGFIEEMISGQKTLKAYDQEENTIHKFDDKNKEAVDAYYKAEYYGSVTGPTVNFINNLSLSLISVFGALLYLVGQMSVGNISSFVLYSRKFSGPINEAANIISEFQSALAAAERVFQLMDEKPEPFDKAEAKELEEIAGNVEIKDVSFGYQKDNIIIHNLNLNAQQGKLVAVVGPTGAGKTTFINLLMRFYDVNDGNIYVDKNNIYDVTRKSLRKSYAMVLQDTWLFEGTIFENIAYGKENATMEEVVAAAKAAKIHSFIKRLPNGYHTILSDDGTNISKGQKQLLTIARAMLLDSHMLILDEATSNVDTRTEVQIQHAMRKLMEHKTCFVIAHRLSTIQNADVILVVNHGEIVEQGTHKELLKKQGFYYQLYKAQFE